MAGTRIVRVDQLSDAIVQELEKLNDDAIKACNDAADQESQEAVTLLRANSPVRTDGYKRKHPPGSYAKGWRRRKVSDKLGVDGYVVYNEKHYQLTHLLEFGHIIAATGGRSIAIPHIKPVNESVSEKYVQIVMDSFGK